MEGDNTIIVPAGGSVVAATTTPLRCAPLQLRRRARAGGRREGRGSGGGKEEAEWGRCDCPALPAPPPQARKTTSRAFATTCAPPKGRYRRPSAAQACRLGMNWSRRELRCSMSLRAWPLLKPTCAGRPSGASLYSPASASQVPVFDVPGF